MRALVFDGKSLAFDEHYPTPRVGRGEALIRVRLAGICGTDLEIVRGYAGFRGVLGHEFVGVVERCANREWVGRHVVGDINIACGRCKNCRAKTSQTARHHCERREVLGIRGRDGAFAEYLTLPVANLVRVPDDMPDEVAVFAEPVAAALHVLDATHIDETTHALVLGDGRLGILVAQALKLKTPHVVLQGKHESKLARARKLGIKTQLAGAKNNRRYNLVVECTGSSRGVGEAMRLVRPQGVVVLKSTVHDPVELPASALVVNEIQLIGSRCGSMRAAIDVLTRGDLKVEPLIDEDFPLTEACRAFQLAKMKRTLKVLLRP